MGPLEPFLTDEFWRYSAECRRLGRLSSRPSDPARAPSPPAQARQLFDRLAPALGEWIQSKRSYEFHRLVPSRIRSGRR